MDAILQNTFLGNNSTTVCPICTKFCTKTQNLAKVTITWQILFLILNIQHGRWTCIITDIDASCCNLLLRVEAGLIISTRQVIHLLS